MYQQTKQQPKALEAREASMVLISYFQNKCDIDEYEMIMMTVDKLLEDSAVHVNDVNYPYSVQDESDSNIYGSIPRYRCYRQGFFCTGHSDVVICYSCGLTLRISTRS